MNLFRILSDVKNNNITCVHGLFQHGFVACLGEWLSLKETAGRVVCGTYRNNLCHMLWCNSVYCRERSNYFMFLLRFLLFILVFLIRDGRFSQQLAKDFTSELYSFDSEGCANL